MLAAPAPSEFQRAFSRVALRVHRRRALRQALTGLAMGAALGALYALASWALRAGQLRPFALCFAVIGAGVGALLAARRRWSDRDVALYLDARLDGAESVTTAVGLSSTEPALAHVTKRAARVLEHADPTRVAPRLWTRAHLSLPLSAAAIAILCWLPLPPRPAPAPAPPGAARVQVDHLQGLERIEALAGLPAQNPEQQAHLKQLAEQAKKLRESLAKGLERREALSEIAKLRDGIAAERLKFGDRENRAGLDAALGAFGNNKALRDAQKALSNGDLTAFDEEMQRLASRAESSDRKAAREALEEAAKAARKQGAKGLASALDAERKSFAEREARSEALRELARSLRGKLSPEARKDLEEFGSSGDPDAEHRLEQGLERALEGLTPEERERLAQRVQEQLDKAQGDAAPLTKKELEQLAKQLSSKQGLQALEEQLRELAKPAPSDDARRERGLGEAERGGSEAERGLGAVPMPMDDPGNGAPSGPRPIQPGAPGGAPGPGSHDDKGTGEHHGATPEIAAKELRSKADARLQPGAPMHGATLGRAPARAGETANQLGTGTLGEARSAEVGAVDHADIPEEYREQVGRYFEP